MLRKTVVVVDYDTQEIPRVLDSLGGLHDILVVGFNRLPEMPMPVRRVLAIVFLCTKPDEDVLQSILMLRTCYADLKIIVISPQPTLSMVAQTVVMGANDYLNLANEDLTLGICLQRAPKETQSIPSVFSTLTWTWRRFCAWLQPRQVSAVSTHTQKLTMIEPLLAVLPSTWTMPEVKEIAPPQYKDLIEVQFFGDFKVTINGQPFSPKTNGLLLAYLLFYHSRPIHKEVLMSKFWGENVNDAKNCLNAAIFSLRKSLAEVTPEKTIIFKNDYYTIDTAVWHIETDGDAFTKSWEKSRALMRTQGLESAISELNNLKALYIGDFLPNFNNEWALGKQDEFREKHLQALNLLSEFFWTSKKLNDCIDSCLDILQVDDCFEPTHRRLMECYLMLKMKDKAIRQYKKCGESLRKLNITPERETENLYLSILKV
jgi:DNA-binding SARP family transcriptional activator